MTDTQPKSPSQALPSSTGALPPGAKKLKKPKRNASPTMWPFVLVLVLILALVAVAAVYFWQQLEQQNTRIQIATKNSDSYQNQLSQREKSHQAKFKSIDAFIDLQTSTFRKLEKQSQFNAQQLHDLGARNRADWLLAEAEYLMHLANQRLTLEHDIRSAEAILISADQVLAENDDPGLLMVRQALATEILALQQTNMADIEGLYLRLSAMIKSLDGLNSRAFLSQNTDEDQKSKTAKSGAAPDDALFSWGGLWQSILQDLQKVFIIRRLDHAVEPLLAPEQSYYLKQNLRLMLEQATLSILDNNQVIYQDSLEKSSQWLTTYFDLSDAKTRTLLEQIENMKLAQINPEIPDISGSIRLLKRKIESMYLNHSLGKLSQPSQVSDAKKTEGEIK